MSRRFLIFGLALTACVAYREPAVRGLPPDDRTADLSAVWIGHATVLLRMGGHTVLTDPNLGGAIIVLPRVTPASVTPAELPPIQFALISHPHMDHLDPWTLRKLGRHAGLVVPRGAESYVQGLPEKIEALAPWQSIERGGVRVTAVPVKHGGGRYLIDQLWNHAHTGYVIEAAGRTVFFAGDTAADPADFEEIGRRFPGIDLALIPIAPAKGHSQAHVHPPEALDVFAQVGARYMVPIHFETFANSDAPVDLPRRILGEEVTKRGLSDRVFALHVGERLVLGDAGPRVIGAHEHALVQR